MIHLFLKADKDGIIAEYGLCYYMNDNILQAEMAGRPMLTEKELLDFSSGSIWY